MNVFERMLNYSNINGGNETYSKMIRTIFMNLETVVNGSIYDVADLCYTSTTSVGRMCKDLGYNGFKDFHRALSEVYTNYNYHNRLLNIDIPEGTQDIKNVFAEFMIMQGHCLQDVDTQDIDTLLQMLHDCEEVRFFDFSNSVEMLLSLQMNLALDNKWSYVFYESYDKGMENLNEKCLMVFEIPDQIYTAPLWDVFYETIESPAKTVLLTHTKLQKRGKGADLVIPFKTHGSSMDAVLFNVFWKMISYVYRQKFLN